jgi:hypothetical protein
MPDPNPDSCDYSAVSVSYILPHSDARKKMDLKRKSSWAEKRQGIK